MNSTVSVIIPAYNKAEKTIRAVNSVLAQTIPCECIVIDDGSIDNTYLSLFMHSHIDKFTLYRQPNQGASAARNKGIEIALEEFNSDYIAFLDCDDWWKKYKLEMSIGYDFCHTAAHKEDKVYGVPKGNLLLKNYICNSTVVVSKHAIEKAGGFDENLFCAADWDMWLRLSEHFKPIYKNIPLTYYDI